MNLRDRFNLVFAAMLGTVMTAFLLVFVRASSYYDDMTQALQLGQWATALERKRAELTGAIYEIQSCEPLEGDNSMVLLLDSLEGALARLPELSAKQDPYQRGRAVLSQAMWALNQARGAVLPDGEGVEDLAVYVDQLQMALRAVSVHFQSMSVASQGAASDTGFQVVSWAAYACVLVVVEFGVFWILVRGWTIYPMMSLAENAKRLHKGDQQFRLPEERTDEIGQLAVSLNEMMSRLQERERWLARARELAAIGELCSGVAHGMRNPLAVIRLSAQRFAQGGELDDRDRDLVDEIIQQVDRLNDRITRLLRFANSIEPRYQLVDFAWLSSVACRESMAIVNSRGVRVVVEDETGGARCRLDPDLTVQALAECISNSAHHSQPGQTITLRGRVIHSDNGHGPEWRVSIEDQGKGIEPQVRQNIFDLFFTLRENGTGVGLTMVKRIVEQQNGKILVESEPNHGATFHLCWPLN